MESHLAAVDSQLSSQFVHKISGGTADWATKRHEAKWYNSGGNSFSVNGVKVIRFDLTCSGSEMLDPLSCILQFKLKNDSYDGTANKNIHMATDAHSIFRRITVKCSGVTVSDIDFSNRLAHMLMEFVPTQKRSNLAIMTGQTGTVVENEMVFGIPLISPLFLQDKMLPLNFMSLQLSFELVDAATDIMMKDADLPAGVTGQGSAWHIEEPVVVGSLITLDSSLSNEFSNTLLKGRSLTIPMQGYFVMPSVVTNGAGGFQIAMTRSLSRINKIYQTYTSNANSKYVVDMVYPALSATAMMSWQAQIGPTRYPAWGSLDNIPSYWWNLQQAIGTHQSVFHSNGIDTPDYLTNSFVVGLNLTKIISNDDGTDSFTGQNTRQGDLLTFKTTNLSTNIDTAWTVLQYSQLLILNESGVEVFE